LRGNILEEPHVFSAVILFGLSACIGRLYLPHKERRRKSKERCKKVAVIAKGEGIGAK
jgi:hypothetical protein